jgi:hypothetical protein
MEAVLPDDNNKFVDLKLAAPGSTKSSNYTTENFFGLFQINLVVSKYI